MPFSWFSVFIFLFIYLLMFLVFLSSYKPFGFVIILKLKNVSQKLLEIFW